MFWLEFGIAALLGLTAIATSWAGYRATIVRDDASSALSQGIRTLNLAAAYLLHFLIGSTARIGWLEARGVHFSCQNQLTGVENTC